MTTSIDAAGQDELDERRLQVIVEQAKGLRWQIVLTAAIVAAVCWRAVPTPALALWFAAVIASREWRSHALTRMAQGTTRPIAERLEATVKWNLLIGACNGSAAMFMSVLDTALDAVLTMILVSWGAGAVSTSSTVMRAFIAYASLLFVPTAAMWLATGTWLGAGVGVLVLMFFGVQIRFARRNLETFEESFGIRLENEALARSLAAARDAAEQANREKSRFLAAASHDLRQPLQAITLNSGELSRLPLTAPAGAVAADIRTGVEQLRSMLDALLDLSKLDAGVVVAQPQPLRLSLLIDGVVGTFRAPAAARGLVIETGCDAGLMVLADAELLRRLLANLLDNAIKFTPSGSVLVRADARTSEVDIAVSDSGPGIAANDHQFIFEDMVRLPQGDGRAAAPGHGLGLGIVRRAAALLGTRVVVDSAPGRGATFRWTLPRASNAPSAAAAVRAWSLVGRDIVVLDDDAMVRGSYANALAGAGAVARTVGTIADALAALGTADAAVVDWRLGTAGGGDGFDAIRALRAQRPSLAMVMVTADVEVPVVESARREGVAVLRKPVDIDTLGRALAQAIEQRRAGQ